MSWSFMPSNEKYHKQEAHHTERRILSPTAKVSYLCVCDGLVIVIGNDMSVYFCKKHEYLD